MGYFTNEPMPQPALVDRRDYVRECRRLAASGMNAKAIARQLDLTYVGVLELLLDDAAMKRS